MHKINVYKNSLINQLSSCSISNYFLLTPSVIIYSCQKEIKENNLVQQPQQGLIQVDIAALKDIYNKAISSSNGSQTLSHNSTLNFIRTLNVNWDTYTLQKRKDSSIVAEFDMKNDTGLYILKKLNFGDTVKYKNKTTVTFIKFKDGSRLNFFTKIIEDLTLPGSRSVMDKLHYNQVPYGFNGMILYYNLDRQYINGYRYVNGGIQGTVSLTTTPPVTSEKSVNSVKPNEALSCDFSPIYAMVCTSDGGATYSFTCGLIVVGYSGSCTGGGGGGSVGGDTGGGGSPGGPNNPSPTPPDPCSPPSSPVAIESVSNGKRVMVVQQDPAPIGGGGGTGTGSNPPCATAQFIINNVTNPCLHDNVTTVLNVNGINKLQVAIANLFGTSATLNLTVTQSSSINDYGITSPPITSNGITNISMVLNDQSLPGASKEFTSAVIIHETIHAYMFANGLTSSMQHEAMAVSYINQISSILQSIYPNLSNEDATALSWGGLSGTGSWNILKSISPDYALKLDQTQTNYNAGIKGNKCN